jgi:hypothetical protein
MRIALALFVLCAMLPACRGPGITLSSSASGEAGESASWAQLSNGEGQFECRKSVTGRCHYILYVEDCETPASNDACAVRVVQAFVLRAGQTRQFHGLPVDVRACQDHEAMPVAPDCGRRS